MVRRVRCEDGVLVVRVSGGGEVRLRVVVHGAGWRAGSGEAWFPVLEGLADAAGGWCEGLMYALFSLDVRRELVERLLDRGCSVEHLEIGLGALLSLRHALVERIGVWLGQCGGVLGGVGVGLEEVRGVCKPQLVAAYRVLVLAVRRVGRVGAVCGKRAVGSDVVVAGGSVGVGVGVGLLVVEPSPVLAAKGAVSRVGSGGDGARVLYTGEGREDVRVAGGCVIAPWGGWKLLPVGRSRVMGLSHPRVFGIPLPTRDTDRSFVEYLHPGEVRWKGYKTREQSKEWSLWQWRMPLSDAQPYCFAFSRAQSTVKAWARGRCVGSGGEEVARVAREERLPVGRFERLVYRRVAPTCMSSAGQHLFVFGADYLGCGLGRSLGVGEVADMLGLPRVDPMFEVLVRDRSVNQALGDLGDSMSGQLLTLLLGGWGLEAAGLLGREVTYGSHYSGLDMPAMVLRQLSRAGVIGEFRHVFAAEDEASGHADGAARARMLREVMGGGGGVVYGSAQCVGATRDAPAVDVFASTFECDPNSGGNRASTGEDEVANRLGLSGSLRYVRERVGSGSPPSLVLLENTADLVRLHRSHFDSVVAMLVRLPYTWHIDVLCPSKHADVPNTRERVYFVGVLKGQRVGV